jgi:hypothetical protein
MEVMGGANGVTLTPAVVPLRLLFEDVPLTSRPVLVSLHKVVEFVSDFEVDAFVVLTL